MAIKFNNCTFQNGGTIVSAETDKVDVQLNDCYGNNIFDHAFKLTPDSNFEANSTNFSNTHKSIVNISESSFLRQLGLSSDTDIDKLKALIIELKRAPEESRRNIITESFLSTTSNLSTIAVNILQALPYINF